MSEIYAPGSIAGPQGPAGPAGSQGSVTALASSVLPTLGNLFDSTKVVAGTVQPDGTIHAYDNWASSGLIFCPGATSMITNLPISVGAAYDASFALYDANGDFISALPTSNFTFVSGEQTPARAAFPLPGSQVYVRFTWFVPSLGSYYSTASLATGMVYATLAGTAVLPGTFQPFGFDTPGDVNAKDAVVAANAAAALAASLTTAVQMAMNAVLPSAVGGGRNVFDNARALCGYHLNTDGSVMASGGTNTSMLYAPNATEFITNLPVRGVPNGFGICLYDALGNFIEDISATFASDFTGPPSNCLAPNVVYALPGTQTYIRFSYSTGDLPGNPMFFAGTAASPCPSSLPQGASFPGIAPATIKTASQLGCATDASTDCAALLNAFLATASAANPIKLILDGMLAVSTALVISPNGHTTIEGIGYGSGVSVIGGAANAININSAGCGSYNVTAPARTATNILLRDFSVAGVELANCSDVLVDNLNFTCAPNFALTFSNANNVTVTRSTFGSAGTFHDGVHVDGKCEDILISDCYFATGDDAIALNAPEGYGGDISRVTVTNCIFDHSLTVMRIYTSIDPSALPTNNVHKVRNVVVSNCAGTTNVQCFNLGITNDGLSATADADQIQDLSISNCTLSSPLGIGFLLTPIGSVSFRGVKFIPTSTAPVIQVWAGFPFGEIALDDFTVLRNADGNAAPTAFVQLMSGATVDRLSLRNCRVVDAEGSSYTVLPALVDVQGTVAALRMEAIDMTHITALASSAGWTGVTALRGNGVMGTGAQVPDSVMDNNALYLSSNASGAPSIKVGGAAKRLTLA